MSRLTVLLTALVVFMPAAPTEAQNTISVPGTAIHHFAGQTPGDLPLRSTQYLTGGHYTFHGDGDTLACLPPSVDVSGSSIISVHAVGEWGYAPGPGSSSGPDGIGFYGIATHDEYDDLGISRVVAHANRLIGVFLTDSKPDPGSIPPILSSAAGDDMTHPMVQQSFDIGASLEGITVPEGATRLFFGLRDGWGWYNNVGSVTVTVVPEPSTLALAALGLMGIGYRRRKRA